MKKIKVLFIHHTTALGGATNSMLFTIDALPKDQFETTVLFLENPGLASELFQKKDIETKHLTGIVNYQHSFCAKIKWFGRNPIKPITQFFKMLFSISKIKNYLQQRGNFDIVHLNTSVMLPVGIACKLVGIKVVWHNREIIFNGFFGIRKFLVSEIIKWSSNKIIHISETGKKSIGDNKKSEVIYNYLDFTKFDKDEVNQMLQTELNLPPQTKIIIMLGGIVHSKGADVLIEAIPGIIKNHTNVHFVFVGYPPKKVSNQTNKKDIGTKCLQLINDFKIQQYVTFLGLRNDIPDVLASSNILVWPATVPHFSRPIIEAQAMGVPAVATNFEVTQEVIIEGETGLTFENGNSKELASKINLLLDDQALYQKISEQAFHEAKNRYDADKNIKKVMAIYQSLLN
jgi:glycosyltransferase involved in cell wall biosynthesis